MKNRLSKSLAFSAILMMLLSTMAIFPTYALPDDTIYLDPSDPVFDTSSTLPCYKFNVTVWVDSLTTAAWAYQVNLAITPDTNWLNITNAWNPTWDAQWIFSGLATVQPLPAYYDFDVDTYIESVKLGDTILVGSAVIGGPYKLAIIEFHITTAPGKYETLFENLNIDNADTYVLDGTLAEITVTKTDGSCTYDWSPPATDPNMAVVPDTLTFDQYTNWTDPPHDFTVDIYIENLDIGWALHNASFNLNYNTPEVILSVQNVAIDPAWTGPNTVGVVPGTISIYVQGHPAPAGDVLVATITFRIIHQGTNPPQALTDPNMTDLTFSDIILYDTFGTIPTDPPEDGEVIVEPFLALPLPHFEVDSIVLGPELVICEQYGIEFDVDVSIKNLHFAWNLVGFCLRVCYDPAILEVVSVTEGPWMQDPTWNWYGTYPIIYPEEDPMPGVPCTHLLLADLILPNATGYWDQPSPEGEGIVFTIRFKPLVQSWTETYVVDMDIYPTFPGCYGVDEDGNDVPFDEVAMVDGSVTILPIDPIGRRIDVWFVNPLNGGYGIHQYADLVLPQTEITLTAKVTYNWWPVQYKKVTFEVRDNNGDLWGIFQDDTDDEGHAYVTFRMPWPCDFAEELLGKWNVTVSVTLADVVINDWVIYDYDYLIHIWKVTTDKPEYMHCEDVEVTVEYGTKAMRLEDVILAVTITDELGVPIGVALIELTVGGACFCTYENYTTTVTLHVDKFAYAGLATVHASFLNALPSEGGEAVAQEVTTTFYILPC